MLVTVFIMLSFPDQGCGMLFHLFKSASVSLQHWSHGSYSLLGQFHPMMETFVNESLYLGFAFRYSSQGMSVEAIEVKQDWPYVHCDVRGRVTWEFVVPPSVPFVCLKFFIVFAKWRLGCMCECGKITQAHLAWIKHVSETVSLFSGLLWSGDQFHGDQHGNHRWSGFWDCILPGNPVVWSSLSSVSCSLFMVCRFSGGLPVPGEKLMDGVRTPCSLVLRSSVYWFSFFNLNEVLPSREYRLQFN